MFFIEYRKTGCKIFRSGWFLLSLEVESKIKIKYIRKEHLNMLTSNGCKAL